MQPDQSETRSFVNVPVPQEYVVQVMTLISNLDAGIVPASAVVADPAPATIPGRQPGPGSSGGKWTLGDVWDSPAELRRIGDAETETTRLLVRVLDFLARGENVGQWHNLTELAEGTGESRDQLKHMWTHLSRHLKKHYPSRWWPLDSGWGDLIPVDGQHIAYYRVTPEQANVWISRGEGA